MKWSRYPYSLNLGCHKWNIRDKARNKWLRHHFPRSLMKLHCYFSLVPHHPKSSYPLYISHSVKLMWHVWTFSLMFSAYSWWSGNQGKIETPPNQPNRMAEFNFNSNILKEEEVRKREPKISFPMVHITAWMTYVWKTMFLKCGLRGQVVIKHDCKLEKGNTRNCTVHRGDADLFNIWVDPCVY